jgi:hypothetical protein
LQAATLLRIDGGGSANIGGGSANISQRRDSRVFIKTCAAFHYSAQARLSLQSLIVILTPRVPGRGPVRSRPGVVFKSPLAKDRMVNKTLSDDCNSLLNLKSVAT